MKARWRKFAARINALSQRERVIVFIAALAVTVFIMNTLFIDAPRQRIRVLSADLQQQQAELPGLRQQVAELETAAANPEAAAQARREALRKQIAEANSTLAGMQENLVPASEMRRVLEDMLARSPRLHIVSLKTLPASPIVDVPPPAAAPAAAPGAPAPVAAAAPAAAPNPASAPGAGDNLYKHGVEVTLEGSYSDLHEYLARAERMPWRMFWSRAVLDSTDYPRVHLTITVYTLSLDPAWLQV